jgi:hypothetical protein
MSEHSKYYHDEDRNKPLPGAGSSEITALAEANKLLAAKVTEAESVIARLLVAAMSLHTAVNKHVAADDRTSLGVAFEEMDNAMAAAVFDDAPVSAQAAPVAASIGDDEKFKRLALAWFHNNMPGGFEKLVAHIDSRAAKVSARAADAPSEPSDNAMPNGLPPISASTYGSKTVCELEQLRRTQRVAPDNLPRWIDNMKGSDPTIDSLIEYIVWQSRAADALDSQPTVPAGWKLVPIAETLQMTDAGEAALEADGHCDCGCPRNADSGRVYAAMLAAAPASSQPTDGEVRNG